MKSILIPSKVYDVLKKIIQVVIPALLTCFIALANIWNWNIPVDAIVASVTAITACIGIILGISTQNYYDLKNEEESNV